MTDYREFIYVSHIRNFAYLTALEYCGFIVHAAQWEQQMKAHSTDNVLGVVEHDNGRAYQIKYIEDNKADARFVVAEAETGKRLGGFPSYKKAETAAKNRDKPLDDPIYERQELKIQAATDEEVQAALAGVFPRSELTKQLQDLEIMQGIKVQGELKKVRQAVYSFAQGTSPKRKFTVRIANEAGWLLIIRIA